MRTYVEVTVPADAAARILEIHAHRLGSTKFAAGQATDPSPQYANGLRKRADGEWVVTIPAGYHIVGYSPITGGPILGGPWL